MKLLKYQNIIGKLKIILIGLCLVCHSDCLNAKVIESESLVDQLIQSYRLMYQCFLEINVIVYDPEVFARLDEEIDEEFTPFELKENGYKQRVVWVRDEYLMIETLDDALNPLHFYVEEYPDQIYSQGLSEDRQFSAIDVGFPHIMFYTKHVPFLLSRLGKIGIVTAETRIVTYQNNAVYRLGSDQDNIIVDPNSFRVLEINQSVQVGSRYYPLRIEFSDWDPVKTELPRLTRFFINSRLIKLVQVTRYDRSMGAERNEFVKKYKEYFPPRFPFSSEVDYGK